MEGINTEVVYQDLASLSKGKKGDILMLIAQHATNIAMQKPCEQL